MKEIHFDQKSSLPLRELFHRFLPFLRPFLRSFSFCFLLILASTFFEVLAPVWLGRIVDTLGGAKDEKALIRYAILYFSFMVSKNLCDFTHAFWIQRNGERIAQKLRSFLFTHTLKLPVPFFDRTPTGRILTRIINDVKSMSELFTASISVVFLDCWIILGTMIAMAILDWKVTLLLLIPIPLLFRTALKVGRKTTEGYWEARRKLSEINAFLGEHYLGLKTIQMMNLQKKKQQRFEKLVQEHQEANDYSLKTFASIQPVNNFWNGLVVAVLLLYSIHSIRSGNFTLGTLVIFLGYIRNLFQPIRDLIEKYNTFLSAKVSAERISFLLAEAEEETTSENVFLATPLSIQFSNVSFTYPQQEKESLNNINLEVSAGSRIGIIGPTGSGKSTMIRLLLRFYHPTQGDITVNNISLKKIPVDRIRKLIGVVHQDLFLFRASLRDNLIFENRNVSDQTLIHHLETVGLWEKINPRGGLDFQLEENGNNLSNGEKQLINLARILILDPPILIFDEATSSIDPILEMQILKGLETAMRNRTCLVIAHRYSTLKSCSFIFKVENGMLTQVAS